MSTGLLVGGICTVLWVCVVVALGIFAAPPFPVKPDSLSAWGDYLAGFLSPVALLWVIGALYSQRREHLEAAKIAERAALQSTYQEYSIRLERLRGRMINHIGLMKTEVRKRLYNSVNLQKYKSLSSDLHRRTISSDDFAAAPIEQAASKQVIETFGTLFFFLSDDDLRQLTKTGGSSMVEIELLMRKFLAIFDAFEARASSTGSLLLIDEDDEFLAKAFRNYFGIVDKPKGLS